MAELTWPPAHFNASCLSSTSTCVRQDLTRLCTHPLRPLQRMTHPDASANQDRPWQHVRHCDVTQAHIYYKSQYKWQSCCQLFDRRFVLLPNGPYASLTLQYLERPLGNSHRQNATLVSSSYGKVLDLSRAFLDTQSTLHWKHLSFTPQSHGWWRYLCSHSCHGNPSRAWPRP